LCRAREKDRSRALGTEPERKKRESPCCNKKTRQSKAGYYDGKLDWLPEGSRDNC